MGCCTRWSKDFRTAMRRGANILGKFDAHSRTAAVSIALRRGLLGRYGILRTPPFTGSFYILTTAYVIRFPHTC